MISVNPANNQVIQEYQNHTPKEIGAILDMVHTAQKYWQTSFMAHRRQCMHKAAELLRSRTETLAGMITSEMGKIIRESRVEIEKCAWVCEYYADHAREFLQDDVINSDAGTSYVTFDPLGVILAVMPWNFPFWQVFRFAAPALMAGNGAVLKHASNVTGCALLIEQLFRDAGFPENLFRSVLIPGKTTPNLLSDDRIAAVTLTGSEPAGSAVSSAAGKHIKKSVLELGGSDPFIVLEDANLDHCLDTAVTARMLNAGQSCIAAKRFIVVDQIYEKFVSGLTDRVKVLKVGDPMDESTEIGPLARPDLADELEKQVQRSVEMGARPTVGGGRMDAPGCFYQPTVLADVQDDMPAFREETFGPVAAVIRAANEGEAVNFANRSEFGLGASLWTCNLENISQKVHAIEAGAVFVNGMVKSDPRLPFGGIKKSGFGRELSYQGIREFVNIKTVWIQ